MSYLNLYEYIQKYLVADLGLDENIANNPEVIETLINIMEISYDGKFSKSKITENKDGSINVLNIASSRFANEYGITNRPLTNDSNSATIKVEEGRLRISLDPSDEEEREATLFTIVGGALVKDVIYSGSIHEYQDVNLYTKNGNAFQRSFIQYNKGDVPKKHKVFVMNNKFILINNVDTVMCRKYTRHGEFFEFVEVDGLPYLDDSKKDDNKPFSLFPISGSLDQLEISSATIKYPYKSFALTEGMPSSYFKNVIKKVGSSNGRNGFVPPHIERKADELIEMSNGRLDRSKVYQLH